jgi:hypothetical protein
LGNRPRIPRARPRKDTDLDPDLEERIAAYAQEAAAEGIAVLDKYDPTDDKAARKAIDTLIDSFSFKAVNTYDMTAPNMAANWVKLSEAKRDQIHPRYANLYDLLLEAGRKAADRLGPGRFHLCRRVGQPLAGPGRF